jgi:hypothetical protein
MRGGNSQLHDLRPATVVEPRARVNAPGEDFEDDRLPIGRGVAVVLALSLLGWAFIGSLGWLIVR